MNDVTVGIKAFLRLSVLEQALTSLEGRGFAQVIVADDSKITDARRQLYRRFEGRLPLLVLELPYRSGIAYGRNRMVENCATPYFLLMDDDHVLEGDISPLREVLDSCARLGGVAAFEMIDGKVSSGCGNLYKFKSFVLHDVGYGPHRRARQLPSGTAFSTYDMVSNFTLFKTAVFDEVRWDETFVIGREHVDFYLAQQRLGKWLFAVTPDYNFIHVAETAGELADRYRQMRFDPHTAESMNRYFNGKWGLSRGIFWGLSHQHSGLKLRARLLHALLGLHKAGHRSPR